MIVYHLCQDRPELRLLVQDDTYHLLYSLAYLLDQQNSLIIKGPVFGQQTIVYILRRSFLLISFITTKAYNKVATTVSNMNK